MSGPQEIEIAGHEHGVEPIERPRHRVIVSANVTHKLSAKAFLEPVNPPQRIVLAQHVGSTPQVVDSAALAFSPAHGLPLQEVIGHQVAVLLC